MQTTAGSGVNVAEEKIFGVQINGIKQWGLALASMDAHIRKNMEAALFRAGVKVQARAQEILTEKGHVVTGNLRRSLMTESFVDPSGKGWFVRVAADTDRLAEGYLAQKEGKIADNAERGSGNRLSIGTFVYYAPFVELLPDGGYMLPARLEMQEQVVRDISDVIDKSIEVYNRKAKSK